jgi:Tol biopolymer transport system component
LNRSLVWVDMEGKEAPLDASARPYRMVRLSPDGRRIAGYYDDMREVWAYDIARNTFLRVSSAGTTNLFPLWMPNGREILYMSTNASANAEGTCVFRRDVDSNAPAVRVTPPGTPIAPYSISADAKTLIVGALRQDTGFDIGVLSLPDGGPPHMLAATEFDERSGEISPDGRWLAYEANDSGQPEVYVQPFPAMDRRWLISANGGGSPVWAPDGRTLYYRHGDAMMAVPIQTEPTFSPGQTRELFRGEYESDALGRTFDLAPDGKRFLMIRAEAESPTEPSAPGDERAAYPREMNVVLNWFEVIRERAVAAGE